jgi:hypothetical protein
VILKLGIDPEARALIQREADVLESCVSAPHLPAWRGKRENASWSGMALQFVDGQTPAPTDTAGMRVVLQAWLDAAHPVPLEALAPWQRLATQPGARSVVERVAGRMVAPALFHGDFAPWNVRAERAPSGWTVIDWERGERTGVPGWDWFHWMIHVSVLVHRHNTAASVEFLNSALGSPDFQQYAAAAQITGIERILLAGYLIYLHEFIVPPVIKDRIAQLRDAIAASL